MQPTSVNLFSDSMCLKIKVQLFNNNFKAMSPHNSGKLKVLVSKLVLLFHILMPCTMFLFLLLKTLLFSLFFI